MHPDLSFDQAPPVSVPFRFFLTAPLFGAFAGLALAWLGPAVLASRWNTSALAVTHLLSVGFMLQAMCGALLQFVPVTTGGNIWRPRLVAGILHPLLVVAALSLVAALALGQSELFKVAASLFGFGLGGFILVVGLALLRTPAQGMSIHVLRLALCGLAVTVLLGVLLAIAFGWSASWQKGWPLLNIINVHAAWGLGGWALLLVIGVSYLVVPMFQLTPAYPLWLSRLLPYGLFLALGLWSLQLIMADDSLLDTLKEVVAVVGLLIAALYAGVTLWLQVRRRRRLTDVTFEFWRGAMLALLGLVASWMALEIFPLLGENPRAPLWLGVLAFPGVFVSVINGMLYKIVPFLIWLHLQRLGGLKVLPPNIKQMIPEQAMRRQFRLHFLSLGLLLGAVLWPALTSAAGLMFAASCLWLEWNLIGAVRLYMDFRTRSLKDQTREDAGHRES